MERFVYDCTDVEIDLENIKNLNSTLQVQNRTQEMKFIFSSRGQPPQVIFDGECAFEKDLFKCSGKQKRECELKIKTKIWEKFTDYYSIQGQLATKKIKTEAQSYDMDKYTPYQDFKSKIDSIKLNSRILVVDLENVGEKSIQSPEFIDICKTHSILVICVFARILPCIIENDVDIIYFKREDLHKDSADEGIRRIIFYLVDCKGYKKLGLATKDHFGQNIKDNLMESGQELDLFISMQQFLARIAQFMDISVNE